MSVIQLKPNQVVPVQCEMNHHEIYNGSYVRIYIARLEPGQETQYHSHDVDTLYIVLKGGKIQTVSHPLDEGCQNVLLKKYGMLYKMQLSFAKIRRRPITLVDGFAFFMPSSNKKVVHKAIASRDNNEEMDLLGIEIK